MIVCNDSSRDEDVSISSECEVSREWSFPCSRSTEDLKEGREGGREGKNKEGGKGRKEGREGGKGERGERSRRRDT